MRHGRFARVSSYPRLPYARGSQPESESSDGAGLPADAKKDEDVKDERRNQS